MNKKIKLVSMVLVLILMIILTLTACSGGSINVLNDQGKWTVTSPDGTISVIMTKDAQGKMSYTVDKNSVRVVEKSELGFDIEEDDFNLTTIHKESSRRVKGTYENKSGKTRFVDYDCNETTITLKGWDFYLDIIMRSYDDGYAFRYNIRAIDGSSGTLTVKDEKTQFALPENTTMWAQEYATNFPGKNSFSYETSYQARTASELNDSQYIAMPLLYQVAGTDYFSLITESELIGSGFYGSYLKVPENKEGLSILKTERTPATLRVEDNQVDYPFNSPWRIGITGDMKTVNESELVEKVYDDVKYWKPDNYDSLSEEEKEIYNYDWVESGIVAWSWLIYNGVRNQNDLSLHREYLYLAKEMGWSYVLLDGGWNNNFNEANFLKFMDDANEAGIKVLVWCNALTDFGNGNVQILRAKLDKWESYGVAGIKIDFFDGQNAIDNPHQGEDIDTIKWYETVYQETAKRKMVVNCHGSNKPTGERRQYPNVNNREAVYGNEFKRVSATMTVNQMFVRNVIGPTDFTPVVNPLSSNMTSAHQMALSVLFESGTPSMADYPNAYRNSKIYAFYKSIYSLRDKTLFLSGKPDFYYSGAVKAGNEWFVGVINSNFEDNVTVDFSFLDDKEYEAYIFTDNENGKNIVLNEVMINKNDKMDFNLLANGGITIRLVPRA